MMSRMNPTWTALHIREQNRVMTGSGLGSVFGTDSLLDGEAYKVIRERLPSR